MKKVNKLTKYFIAFLVIAFVFLSIGLGTLGSVVSTGNSYVLRSNPEEKQDPPGVVFQLSQPKDDKGKTIYCSLTHVYLNVGIIYSEEGKDAQIRITRSANPDNFSNSSYYQNTATLENFLPDEKRGEKTTAVQNSQFNWIDPFAEELKNGQKLSSYVNYKLTAPTHNLLINEVIFIGEVLRTKNADGTFGAMSSAGVPSGEMVILPVKIYNATPYIGQSAEAAKAEAKALIDAQKMPSFAQSTFLRYTKEEIYTLSSIAEMKTGNSYEAGSVYHGDTVHGTFGLSLVTLGTLIFGMSPFGLRFFPMLASFGVLVLGYFIARDFFKSEKAGLAFAILYALSGLALGAGHLGTPLMLGVFFFLGAFYGCYHFYRHGLKHGNFRDGAPLILAGLSGAAALCVSGAYLVPLLGVCGLFAAGMIKQQRARKYYLSRAIEQVEAEEAASPAPVQVAEGEEVPVSEGRKKVQSVENEYRRKNTVAPVSFFTSLVVGAIFLSFIFLIPAYHLGVKLFDGSLAVLGDGSVSSSINIFAIMANFFAGGFIGVNGSPNAWLPAYTTFVGTGSTFAITSIIVNVFAVIAALAGIAYAIWRIVALCKSGSEFYQKAEFVNLTSLLGGVVVCLLTAIYAKGALAFLFLTLIFALMLAADAVRYFTQQEGKVGKAAKIVCIVGIVLLAVWFVLCGVFTFSIPLPASFMKAFL